MTLAALSQPLPPRGFKEFRILPAGLFRAQDGSGRPEGIAGWVMNSTIAWRIIASLAARDDVLIDYEHQSIQATERGVPAPAAGWFKRAEWREGDGLYAVDARWTAKAAAMIAAKEYRFISPVFLFDKRTGEVEKIVSIGLVNQPALAGLTDLAAASAAYAARRDTDHAIEAFNSAFGRVGVFHPDTPPAELARLKAQQTGAVCLPLGDLAGVPPGDAEKLRCWFPTAWSK